MQEELEQKKQQSDEKENDANTASGKANASAVVNPTTPSQNSASSGATSGGAIQPIQSGNQSREAEQSDLRPDSPQ